MYRRQPNRTSKPRRSYPRLRLKSLPKAITDLVAKDVHVYCKSAGKCFNVVKAKDPVSVGGRVPKKFMRTVRVPERTRFNQM